MFKLLDEVNNPTKRRCKKATSTIVPRKQKTSINLTTQFESGQWIDKLVEEAEDNLQLEFQNARKAVHRDLQQHFPDSCYQFEYKDCVFQLFMVDPITHLRHLRELHPEDDIDAKRLFQLKGDLNESQKRRMQDSKMNKITMKFQEFNIKMQGRQLTQTLEMIESQCDAIINYSFMWKVPATLPCDDWKPKVIPCPI